MLTSLVSPASSKVVESGFGACKSFEMWFRRRSLLLLPEVRLNLRIAPVTSESENSSETEGVVVWMGSWLGMFDSAARCFDPSFSARSAVGGGILDNVRAKTAC